MKTVQVLLVLLAAFLVIAAAENSISRDLKQLVQDVEELENSHSDAALSTTANLFGGNKVNKGKQIFAILDVGSSGTKVIFGAPKNSPAKSPKKGEKVALKSKKSAAVKGLAAAMTASDRSPIAAAWELGDAKAEAGQLTSIDQYMPLIFEEIALDLGSDAPKSGDFTIKMMATAGMRKVTKQANDQAWDAVCNKKKVIDGVTYKTPAKGVGECGTIPGVTEAYYEWYGTALSKPGHGILSMGGASAQAAVPLSKKAYGAWKKFVEGASRTDFGKQINAYAQLPFFNQKGKRIFDFIDFKDKDDIENFSELGGDGKDGLMLVSFLGVPHKIDAGLSKGRDPDAKDNFFAGGLDTTADFASQMFKRTHEWKKRREAFAQRFCEDKLYVAVTLWARDNGVMNAPWALITNTDPTRTSIDQFGCTTRGFGPDCIQFIGTKIGTYCQSKTEDQWGDYGETCAKAYSRFYYVAGFMASGGLGDYDRDFCRKIYGDTKLDIDGEPWSVYGKAPDWVIGAASIAQNGAEVKQLKLALPSGEHASIGSS